MAKEFLQTTILWASENWTDYHYITHLGQIQNCRPQLTPFFLVVRVIHGSSCPSQRGAGFFVKSFVQDSFETIGSMKSASAPSERVEGLRSRGEGDGLALGVVGVSDVSRRVLPEDFGVLGAGLAVVRPAVSDTCSLDVGSKGEPFDVDSSRAPRDAMLLDVEAEALGLKKPLRDC